MGRTAFGVQQAGDWIPAEELRLAALQAVQEGNDISINLVSVDHLDASALQILLALAAEQTTRSRQVQLEHTSPQLRQWFEYSGAAEQLLLHERGNDE